ncbi:MAG TPA: hypothetical protein VFF52_06465 [Isosphaeraceae bacterium]|nr:hypothetical protein [Isosphaeraceae bacterium]
MELSPVMVGRLGVNNRFHQLCPEPAGAHGVDTFSRLLSSETDHLSDEARAELVAQVLRSTTADPGTSPARESESGSSFTHLLADRAAERRRTGHRDEARRIADRIHAFARLLAGRYPDQPAAHLALCIAFQQRTKNAWRTNDRTAIERNWRLALSEARQALILDPQNDLARHELTELERRLHDLLAPPQRDAGAPDRSVPAASVARPGVPGNQDPHRS